MAAATQARRAAFARLRPLCVMLSEKAVHLGAGFKPRRELVELLGELLVVLNSVRAGDGDLIDGPLAEYIFFPLSTLLRSITQLPVLAVEKSMQCLLVLLETAWAVDIPFALAKQLLLFVGFALHFVGNRPAKQQQDDHYRPSEDTHLVVLQCLRAILQSLSTGLGTRQQLNEEESIPVLGQSLVPLLDSLNPNLPTTVRTTAAAALVSFVNLPIDADVLAAMLPAIVSHINGSLMATERRHGSSAMLISLLRALQICIEQTFGDTEAEEEALSSKRSERRLRTSRGKGWRRASGQKICVVLKNASLTANHAQDSVRIALWELHYGVSMLNQETFLPCRSMLIDYLLFHCSVGSQKRASHNATRFISLLRTQAETLAAAEKSLRHALLRFPREIQGTHESEKLLLVEGIRSAHELLISLLSPYRAKRLSLHVLHTLTSTIATQIEPAKSEYPPSFSDAPHTSLLQDRDFDGSLATPLHLVLPSNTYSAQVQDEIGQLVRSLAPDLYSFTPEAELGDIKDVQENYELQASWALALERIQHLPLSSLREGCRDPSGGDQDHVPVSLDALYSLALSALNQPTTVIRNERVTNLGLWTIALQSKLLGPAFRPELLDTLYPMIALNASADPSIRQLSFHCLTSVAKYCGYSDILSMIMHNGDYLINSISLKFLTFDITPQAPAVVHVLLRLCGSAILPFMDDLMEAISTAIDNFHGYPQLCLELFSVQKAFIEVAMHSAALDPGKGKLQTPSTRDQMEGDTSPIDDKTRAAAPLKVYDLIHHMVSATQYHLSQSSPLIRQLCCQIVENSSAMLSADEDRFLPLINDIWPPLIKRLYDPEAFVAIAAARALTTLVRWSDGFMSSRFRKEWAEIQRFFGHYRSLDQSSPDLKQERKLVGDNREGQGTVCRDTGRVLRAVVEMMAEIVHSCRVDGSVLDEIVRAFPPSFLEDTGLLRRIREARRRSELVHDEMN